MNKYRNIKKKYNIKIKYYANNNNTKTKEDSRKTKFLKNWEIYILKKNLI